MRSIVEVHLWELLKKKILKSRADLEIKDMSVMTLYSISVIKLSRATFGQ